MPLGSFYYECNWLGGVPIVTDKDGCSVVRYLAVVVGLHPCCSDLVSQGIRVLFACVIFNLNESFMLTLSLALPGRGWVTPLAYRPYMSTSATVNYVPSNLIYSSPVLNIALQLTLPSLMGGRPEVNGHITRPYDETTVAHTPNNY